ncbi:urease accessory protein UreF [Aurantivibrio infirmus]
MPDLPSENPEALLHLFQLVSPALPVGAYAYSQGLETAIENRWVKDFETAGDWIGNVMSHAIGQLDLPILLRLRKAWALNDYQQVNDWNEFLIASRESKELLLEDTQMGEALHRLLMELNIPNADSWSSDDQPCFVTMFALAADHWKISSASMAHGFLWSWLENQVAAAVKLVPLGQTDAQKLLILLMPKVNTVVGDSQNIEDADIGNNLPRLAIASMQHEVQYSRLFRS